MNLDAANTVDELVVRGRDGRVAVLDGRGTGTVLVNLGPGPALWLAARLREEAHRSILQQHQEAWPAAWPHPTETGATMRGTDWEQHPNPDPTTEDHPTLGHHRWADLIDDDHTRLLPIITRGQRHRGNGGQP